MDLKQRKIIEEKRAELTALLFELAKNETLFSDPKQKSNIYLRLEAIYAPEPEFRFRHFYSDFFPVIVEISDDIELGHISVLLQNLSILMEGYTAKNIDQNGNLIDISDNIRKLYDHINLDVARLSYHSVIRDKTRDDMNVAKQRIDDFNKSLSENEERIRKAESAERNYITILGIFASIVLAFTGGIAFSTSVLENIDAVSPYRLAATVIGLAFVMINIVYILVWFIQQINRHKEETIQYPRFMIAINGVLVIAVAATIFCWYNWEKKADSDLISQSQYSISVETENELETKPE